MWLNVIATAATATAAIACAATACAAAAAPAAPGRCAATGCTGSVPFGRGAAAFAVPDVRAWEDAQKVGQLHWRGVVAL